MKNGITLSIIAGLAGLFWLLPAFGKGRVAELETYRAEGSLILLDETHVRAGSGLISIGPSLRRLGSLRRLISPPWSGTDFKLDLLFNDHHLVPEGYTWYPDEIQQWGKAGELLVRTTTIPLRAFRSVLMIVEIENKGSRVEPVEIEMQAGLTLDRPPAKSWDYSAPESSTPTVTEAHYGHGPRKDDFYDAGVRFKNKHGGLIVNFVSPHPSPRPQGATESLTIAPGTSQRFYVVVVLGDDADYARVRGNLDETLEENDKAWRVLAAGIHARVPRFHASDSKFERFYTRCLVTLMTSRWHVPDFVNVPHYAEGGIDGRGMCTYLWGVGYTAEMLALADPAALRASLERFLRNDLMKSYAYTPLSGEAIGRWYAYNSHSLVRAIHDYVVITGDLDFLSGKINGKRVQDWVDWHAMWPDPNLPPALVDYGFNENILELQRTDAYSHFVPSPNGERYASLRLAAELRRMTGQPPEPLEHRAREVQDLVLNRLWDPEKSWMASLDLAGHRQFAYSIQVFDLLRNGLLPKNTENALVARLNDREFLSAYGVHSLSKNDAGYDYRDVDWGGPGVFAGDAPELVEDLAKAGYPAQAEDLLRRILWWGDRFPYVPQAVRADVMDYRHDGLANCIAGLSGAQSIVFGIFGVKYLPDRKLKIQPQSLSGVTQQSLEGLIFAKNRVDIHVDSETFTVVVNDIRSQAKIGTALILNQDGSIGQTRR